jgi:hypothetical protein
MGPKLPPLATTAILGVVLAGGLGVLAWSYFGYKFRAPAAETATAGSPDAAPRDRLARLRQGIAPAPLPTGLVSRPIPSKFYLVLLVNKLDEVTAKPSATALTDEQRTKLLAELQGIEDKEELTEEEAKKRLDTILEIVKDQKPALKAAGYVWPGEPMPWPREYPNPFMVKRNEKHLKSLRERLEKAKAT